MDESSLSQQEVSPMSSLLDITLTLHSLWRWVVLIVAVVVIVKFGVGWLGKRPWTDLDTRLGSGYAWAMTIQLVLGLVLLILYAAQGAFNARVQIEHAIYGLIATALAHMTRMFKNQPDDRRFRNALLLVLASLLVALFSIWRLRGNVLAGL
jgi:hypothetical protein